MSVRQIYRGDPTTKQYNVTNNFSGGINTTDVDEVTLPNQFRVLENVELSEQGMIQNRKGWGINPVLSGFFDQITEELPNLPHLRPMHEYIKEIYSIDVLLDKGNILNKIETYTDFKEFKDDHALVQYHLMIGIFYKDYEDKYNYGVFEVMNDGGGDWVHFASFEPDHLYGTVNEVNLSGETEFRPKKYTGINRFKHNGKLYLNLSDINNKLPYILEVEVTYPEYWEEAGVAIKVIGNKTGYVPNAYEVAGDGFNILLEDPMSVDSTGAASGGQIQSVYITDFADPLLPLNFIPESGKFQLHIIKSGTIDSEYLEPIKDCIKFYTIDETKLPPDNEYVLSSRLDVLETGKTSGKIVYQVVVNIEDTSKPIYLKVNKQQTMVVPPAEPDESEIIAEYATMQDMLADLTDSDKVYAVLTDRYDGRKQATVYEKKSYRWYPVTTPNKEKAIGKDIINIRVLTGEGSPGDLDDYFWGHDSSFLDGYAGSRKLQDHSHGYNYIRYELKYVDKIKYGGDILTDIPTLIVGGQNKWPEKFDTNNYRNIGNVKLHPILHSTNNIDYKLFYAIFHLDGQALYETSTNPSHSQYNIFPIIDNGLPTISGIKTTSELADLNLVDKTGYFKVGDEYYVYNGGTTLTDKDFTLVDFGEAHEYEITLLDYRSIFDIGNNTNLKKIEPMNLSKFKMLEIRDRLFIYSGNTIRYSHRFNFSYFPANNYIVLPLHGDDEITKIAYFRGSYIIFTKNNIYRMSGEVNTDTNEIVLINDSIGCVSPESVRGINNNLIFMSYDGLYAIKQNYYMEGLENVDKIDRQIAGVIKNKTNLESILYNEQYLLFEKDKHNKYSKTLKQYYNIPFAKNHFPYVVDKYLGDFDNVYKLGSTLLSLHIIRDEEENPTDIRFYQYDRGYTDFLALKDEDNPGKVMQHTYKMVIQTPNYLLGYPTHNKKFKNLYFKTKTTKVSPVQITVFVDGMEFILPSWYTARITPYGEVIYNIVGEANLKTRHARLGIASSAFTEEAVTELDAFGGVVYTLDDKDVSPVYNVDDFELNTDVLGNKEQQTHKLVVSGKGKSYAIRLEQQTNEAFGIIDIGVLYKLGKVKEG